MNVFVEGVRYILDNWAEMVALLEAHVFLVAVSELAAIAFAVPLSLVAVRRARVRKAVLTFGNIAQTVPSLAVIALVFPILGLGVKPALVGLWAYALLPILINTIRGIESINENVVDAARGMGMTDTQILRKIQLPLALPVIFGGIRTSTILIIGSAYLAYFIGADSLGTWVVAGIQLYNFEQTVAGAIPGALLAIVGDLSLGAVQKRLGPETDQAEVPMEA